MPTRVTTADLKIVSQSSKPSIFGDIEHRKTANPAKVWYFGLKKNILND